MTVNEKKSLVSRRVAKGEGRHKNNQYWPIEKERRKAWRDRRGMHSDKIGMPEDGKLERMALMVVEKNLVAGRDVVTALLYARGTNYRTGKQWHPRDVIVVNKFKDAVAACQLNQFDQVVINLD